MTTPAPVELQCKVLVVGGGLAAASAARSAACFGDGVLVASKGPFGRSGATPRRATAVAEQIMGPEFAGNPAVMADTFVIDILETGRYLNDQHLVDLVTEICYDQVNWSEWFGFPVRAEELRRRKTGAEGYHSFMGVFPRYLAPGHSFARLVPFEGTPESLLATYREALDLWGVDVRENIMVTRLLTAEGRVVGAAGFDVTTGQAIRIRANSTVLCAGGATILYRTRCTDGESTGDAYALAYAAGAPLTNLEFVQFSLFPAGFDGQPLPHNDDLLYLGLGGTLRNRDGERFLQSAQSLIDQLRVERAPVANLVSEVHDQLVAGKGPIRSPGGELGEEAAPALRFLRGLQGLQRAGYDWRLDGFEWTLGVERLLGGVQVDYRLTTALPGLWACGEAASGAAGADCLPGWGVAATMSGGFQAGAMAARAGASGGTPAALPTDQVAAEEARLGTLGTGGEPIGASELAAQEDELRALAWRALGVIRNETDLHHARAQCHALQRTLAGRSAASLEDYQRKLELEHAALTAALIATAALHRTETRGQHRREDYPNGDDRVWLKELVLRAGRDGEPLVVERPVALPRHKSRHLAHVEHVYAAFPR